MTDHFDGRVPAGLLIFLVWACPAYAHVASNGFLAVNVTGRDVAGSVTVIFTLTACCPGIVLKFTLNLKLPRGPASVLSLNWSIEPIHVFSAMRLTSPSPIC